MDSNTWTAVVDDDLDETLEEIQSEEDFPSRSKTAGEMLQRGVKTYRADGLVGSALRNAAGLAAIGSVMAIVMFVAIGEVRLLKFAALFALTSIIVAVPPLRKSLFPRRRQTPETERVATDGGEQE